MVRKLISLLMAALIGGAAFADNIPAYAQAGPGPPPAGSGTGTVTSVACPNATITSSGTCSPLASAGTTGNVVTVNGSNVQDGGTALSALLTSSSAASTYAPIASPTFTGTPAGPTATAGTNTTQLATTAFVIANGGGQSTQFAKVSGNWYMPYMGATMTTGSAFTSGRVNAMPFIIPAGMTVSHVGWRIIGTSSGGNIQSAIFTNSTSCTANTGTIANCPSGTSLCTTASQSTTAAGVFNAVCSATLTAGTLYWMLTNADNSAVTCQTLGASQSFATWQIGSATQANINSAAGTSTLSLHATQTFNSWTGVGSLTWTEDNTTATCMLELQSA